jgi:hypothetical protein
VQVDVAGAELHDRPRRLVRLKPFSPAWRGADGVAALRRRRPCRGRSRLSCEARDR